MKKLLVTGGAGFIGTNVCLEGLARKWEVIAFDNLERKGTEINAEFLEEKGVKIVRGDIRNTSDFEKIPDGIEGIVHLAGQCGIPYSLVNPKYDFEVNVGGTINMLEYSRTHGKIPMALSSSNKVYTNITDTYLIKVEKTRYEYEFENPFKIKSEYLTGNGFNENLPLDAFGKYARSPYGTSKVAADLYMQEYYRAFGVPTVINRMSCIYGYHQHGVEDQAWVDWFIRKIMFGDGKINIFGTGKQVRDMLFGTDVAKLYLDEIENIDKVKGQPFNIGGGIENTLSLLEAIKIIEDLIEEKAELTFFPKRHGDQDIWVSDLTKIKETLGWEPTISPEKGIKMMIEAYKK